MTIDRHKMGEKHEEWLADQFEGRQTRGSGNQWRDLMDGRTDRRFESFAWAWDGKSTMGIGIAVTREMLKKAIEQAGGERPMIALRFYDDERLRNHDDWILVKADDFLDLQETANMHLGRDTP
jgi:hypothetical protein